MRGPDAAHRCTAQMLRLQAPHRGSLGRSPRTHLLAWMLRSGSEETTTEAGPANSRARITPICAASPLTTAARGNLRLSHRHISRSRSMRINSCSPIPLSISAWVILPVPPPSSTTGPSPRLGLHARACHRPGKRPRARHDPPDPVRSRRPTPDEERDPGLHPRQTPADAGWEAAVCGESSSVIHGVRYCSTVIVRLPSDGADAGAAFIYPTTCSNSGLITRFDMR